MTKSSLIYFDQESKINAKSQTVLKRAAGRNTVSLYISKCLGFLLFFVLFLFFYLFVCLFNNKNKCIWHRKSIFIFSWTGLICDLICTWFLVLLLEFPCTTGRKETNSGIVDDCYQPLSCCKWINKTKCITGTYSCLLHCNCYHQF